MIKFIYATRDNLAEVFHNPFLSINDATAKRDFIEGVSQNPNIKDDLSLYALGKYNDATGDIQPFPTPKRIFNGLEINAPGEVDETPLPETGS